MRVRFGNCLFDGGTRELRRDGEEVHLSRKAFDLLWLLLERRPEALNKEEIHERLWPGTYVSDGSLANLVSELRRALGDQAEEPRYLRTVHGFGYAFCGEVAEAGAAIAPASTGYSLIVFGREVPLAAGPNLLGREPDLAVPITDVSVSRRHAQVRVTPEGVFLEDLASKNGTFLNGEPVATIQPLADLDEIRIGDVTVVFRRLSTEISTKTSTAQQRPRS